MESRRLIASGRDADIFDVGGGRALRKSRDGRTIEPEARLMAFLADHDYPVPAVHEVRADGSEIVMDLVDGPLMADAITRQPWTLPGFGSRLADLHDQLHEITAPAWLPQSPDGGDRVVHLDLHPLNVIMSTRGPVVIDWANAERGEALSDVGATYALLTCPRMPGPRALRIVAQPLRVGLARQFTRRYRGPALDAHIAAAAERKTLDPNMAPTEIESLHRLARRMRRGAGSGPEVR